jgi:hypothetical protein
MLLREHPLCDIFEECQACVLNQRIHKCIKHLASADLHGAIFKRGYLEGGRNLSYRINLKFAAKSANRRRARMHPPRLASQLGEPQLNRRTHTFKCNPVTVQQVSHTPAELGGFVGVRQGARCQAGDSGHGAELDIGVGGVGRLGRAGRHCLRGRAAAVRCTAHACRQSWHP